MKASVHLNQFNSKTHLQSTDIVRCQILTDVHSSSGTIHMHMRDRAVSSAHIPKYLLEEYLIVVEAGS